MSTANLRWSFSITDIRRSAIGQLAVSGVATAPDGTTHKFVATDRMDPRYPTRFKVNWNGLHPRMPEPVGHGVKEEVLACTAGVDEDLFMGRGARVAIARMCKALVQDGAF